MESNIIERMFAYSNTAMVTYCTMLKDILLREQEVLTDGPNKGKTVAKRKYTDVPRPTIQKLSDSIEYYRTCEEPPMCVPELREQIIDDDIEDEDEDYEDEEVIEEGAFQMREYQKELIAKGTAIMHQYRFVYLAIEVRVGKTYIALGICDELFPANVLFVTKKKAINSINNDYNRLKPCYQLYTINYDSLHKLPDIKWDIIIIDECHAISAFPKPSLRAKQIHDLIKMDTQVILLSGTPTPESYSQMYHQVYGIPNNPFYRYKNFYRFCDDYVDVKKRMINGLSIPDYSHGKDSIITSMEPYTLRYTQKQAGFIVDTQEHVLHVKMSDLTYKLTANLKKTLVVEGKGEVILGDTPVKLMSKMHQLFSGTVKFESGNSMVTDDSKAVFIKEHFAGQKIGIFYKFTEELNALKQVYGDDICTDLSVFEDTDKSIALQIVSGREGISLKQAECLVYYNIDFSATSYWQSRDRMTTMDRLKNSIYWIFSIGGIEPLIYKAVTKKKDFTLRHFKMALKKEEI